MGFTVSNGKEEKIMSSDFYMKNSDGKYIPISFKQIITRDWENKLIVVRIGSDESPANDSEIEETLDSLNDADALEGLENTSFLITMHSLSFEVLDNVKEVGEKCVAVKVTGDDDLSRLGNLQKNARDQLRGKTKKVVVLPTPLTVSEYKEIMDIKKRCDTRRGRRGR
jgi:hypothetical protein